MESTHILATSSNSLQSLQVGFSSIVDRARRLVFGSSESSEDDQSGFEDFVDCQDDSRTRSILRITESGEALNDDRTDMSAPPGIPMSTVTDNISLLPPPGFELESEIIMTPPGIYLPSVEDQEAAISLPPGFDVPPGLQVAPPGLPLKPEVQSSSTREVEMVSIPFTAHAGSYNSFSFRGEFSTDSSDSDVEVAPPGLSLNLEIQTYSVIEEDLDPTPFSAPSGTFTSLSTDSSNDVFEVAPPGLPLKHATMYAQTEKLEPTSFNVPTVATKSFVSFREISTDSSSEDDDELGLYSRKTLLRIGEEERTREHLPHSHRLPSLADKTYIALSVLAGLPPTNKRKSVVYPLRAPRNKQRKRGQAVTKDDDTTNSVGSQESSLSPSPEDGFVIKPVGNVDEILVPSLASLMNSRKEDGFLPVEKNSEESISIKQSSSHLDSLMSVDREVRLSWNPVNDSVTESFVNQSSDRLARLMDFNKEVDPRNPIGVDKVPTSKQPIHPFARVMNMQRETSSVWNNVKNDGQENFSVKQSNDRWSGHINVKSVIKEPSVNDRFEKYIDSTEILVRGGQKKRFQQSVSTNDCKPSDTTLEHDFTVQSNIPSTSREYPTQRPKQKPSDFKIWNYFCRSCDLSDAARKGTALSDFTEEECLELFKKKVIEGAGGVYRPPARRISVHHPEYVKEVASTTSRLDVLDESPLKLPRKENDIANTSQRSSESQDEWSKNESAVDNVSAQPRVKVDIDDKSAAHTESNTTVSSTSTNTLSSLFGQTYQGRSDSKFLQQNRPSIGFGPDRNYRTNVREYERNRSYRRTGFSRTNPIFTKEEYDALCVHMHKFASDERGHQHIIAMLIMSERKVSNFDPREINKMVRKLVQHGGELCKEEAQLKKQFESRLERDGDLQEYMNSAR